MKKHLLLITGFVILGSMAFGGGIVTNTNQSAAWVRLMVRDASTDADAVYFNPAGLIKLNDGFHFSLNSQTIFQNKDVTNDYMLLKPFAPKKYKGEVKAPVFPSAYGTWKKGNFAISFGFNPIGGGGGATLKTGLPSFEIPIADLRAMLQTSGASDYRLDAYLKGTSVFFGYQAGITYKINEILSVYGGVRYVTAKNTYDGHLKDIELKMGENWVPASDVVNGVADNIGNNATMLSGAITAGLVGGDDPISATLAGNLAALGIDPTNMTNNIAVIALTQASQKFHAQANLLSGQEVDVTQKGTGIAPILGVNLNFNNTLNIGIKYEFKTSIQVKNATNKDFILGYSGTTPITMFPDGQKIDNDLPAMLSIGANYKVIPKLSVSGGFHYYFDKSANYGKTLNGENVENSKVIDKNYYELGLGLEYGLTDKILISGGYLYAKTGVNNDYQSDLSFSLTSNTLGGGLGVKLTDNLMVNAGVSYSMYNEEKLNYTDSSTGLGYTNTFVKNTLIIALGLDFNF